MKQRPTLTLADTRLILDAAAAHAQAQGWAVSITVVDDGGHPLGMLRLDGASPLSTRISRAKAETSALGRSETKRYEDIINNGRTAFITAPTEGLLEGGVPIVVQGDVVGAVGVSGVKSPEDAEIARAGIAALGL